MNDFNRMKHAVIRAGMAKTPAERFRSLEKLSQEKRIYGNYAGAVSTSYRSESLALLAKDSHLYGRSLLSRAISLLWMGKLHKARASAKECLVSADSCNSLPLKAHTLLILSRIDLISGYLERARIRCNMGIELSSKLDNNLLRYGVKLLDAQIAGAMYSSDEGWEKALSLLHTMRASQNNPLESEVAGLAATYALARGNGLEALEILGEPQSQGKSTYGCGICPEIRMAGIHLFLGHPGDAAALLNEISFKRLTATEKVLWVTAMKKVSSYPQIVPHEHIHARTRICESIAPEILDYGKEQAKLLHLCDEPTFARLYVNGKGTELTFSESKRIRPGAYTCFYNLTTNEIHLPDGKPRKLQSENRHSRILIELIKHCPTPLSHKDLFETVWGEPYNPEFNDNNLYVAMSKLRKIIKDTKEKGRWKRIRSSEGGRYSLRTSDDLTWAVLIPLQE